ncbi:MAG: hypothetical protein SWK90_16425 [Chloroflexota bacterium]|nr:hypothetical protein [Chloroflexota bacterium]
MFRRRPVRRPPLFRRRPPRPPRPPGAPPPRRPLPSRGRQALARANRLMAGGQFAEAARIFERLSEGAKQRGMLVRAADLMIQAARAHLAADNAGAAVKQAKQALLLFIHSGRIGRVPHFLARMTEALRNKEHHAAANELERAVEEGLGEIGLSLEELRQHIMAGRPKQQGILPTQCTGCGAPLVPDEVEWHDAHTAECPYCGTVVKAP